MYQILQNKTVFKQCNISSIYFFENMLPIDIDNHTMAYPLYLVFNCILCVCEL